MAGDEVGARRAKRGGKATPDDAAAADLAGLSRDPQAPKIGPWLMGQHLHPDPTCAAAARAVIARWNLNWTPVSRVVRALTQEESEHLLGMQRLLDEYRDAYGIQVGDDYLIRAIGAAGALVPVGVEYCTKCGTREAVPGTGLCARDGGQWMDAETRRNIGQQVADHLLDLSMRATRTLADLMDNATSEKVRYDAAVAILDRAGLGAVTKVEHTFDIDSAQKATALVNERLDRLAQRAQQLPSLPAADNEIQDAEVVG